MFKTVTDEESEEEAIETKPRHVKKKHQDEEDLIVDVEGSGGEEQEGAKPKGQPGKGL